MPEKLRMVDTIKAGQINNGPRQFLFRNPVTKLLGKFKVTFMYNDKTMSRVCKKKKSNFIGRQSFLLLMRKLLQFLSFAFL